MISLVRGACAKSAFIAFRYGLWFIWCERGQGCVCRHIVRHCAANSGYVSVEVPCAKCCYKRGATTTDGAVTSVKILLFSATLSLSASSVILFK